MILHIIVECNQMDIFTGRSSAPPYKVSTEVSTISSHPAFSQTAGQAVRKLADGLVFHKHLRQRRYISCELRTIRPPLPFPIFIAFLKFLYSVKAKQKFSWTSCQDTAVGIILHVHFLASRAATPALPIGSLHVSLHTADCPDIGELCGVYHRISNCTAHKTWHRGLCYTGTRCSVTLLCT